MPLHCCYLRGAVQNKVLQEKIPVGLAESVIAVYGETQHREG